MPTQKITCDECDSELDADGFPIDPGPDCGWSHESDCASCGAAFCDMSC